MSLIKYDELIKFAPLVTACGEYSEHDNKQTEGFVLCDPLVAQIDNHCSPRAQQFAEPTAVIDVRLGKRQTILT